MGWVLRFFVVCVLSIFFVWPLGVSRGEERGYLFPDLLLLKFFVGVKGNDGVLLESMWVEDGGIILEGLDGREYKGREAVRGHFREWLSRERVDIQMRVTDLDVKTSEGYVGGEGDGEVLDLKTGLSRSFRVGFEGYFDGCGEEMWCFRRVRLFEVEDGE